MKRTFPIMLLLVCIITACGKSRIQTSPQPGCASKSAAISALFFEEKSLAILDTTIFCSKGLKRGYEEYLLLRKESEEATKKSFSFKENIFSNSLDNYRQCLAHMFRENLWFGGAYARPIAVTECRQVMAFVPGFAVTQEEKCILDNYGYAYLQDMERI